MAAELVEPGGKISFDAIDKNKEAVTIEGSATEGSAGNEQIRHRGGASRDRVAA